MKVLAQRVGGSGHAGQHLRGHFEDGHIPSSWNGHPLKAATLNLVLQVGTVFKSPLAGGATKQYVAANRETYYLQAIQLRVTDRPGNKASPWLPGLIHRNRPHPPQFDHIIEVIAPDMESHLTDGKKEWFELDGPFEWGQAAEAE